MTIPRLPALSSLPPVYARFLEALAERGFSGEVKTDYATRLVAATDNSVYQVLPACVVFPMTEDDVVRLLTLAHEPRFHTVKLSPRGGGTGTNGQALCDGIILDLSRHLAGIRELNLAEGYVRVQPGAVLDQLNGMLKPHGVFFAPNLSPSNRATLGGMINTDASGKGSRVYGKTSQHVLELRAVFMDGSVLDSKPVSEAERAELAARPDLVGSAYKTVFEVVTAHRQQIEAQLPKLQRFLTGYDLAHVFDADGNFNLNSVLCGSEGTLCVITEAKLKLTPLPKHRALLAIRYPEFDAALRAAAQLVAHGPGAIETIDDTIVNLARQDVIWRSVAHLIEAPGEPPAAAINLVEFESDRLELVQQKIASLSAELEQQRGQPQRALGYTLATKAQDIAALWSLRKKGVGLLGNAAGERRPVPFVEDTAVPPESLADYIRDFRAILDRHGLSYGMFGHVDVGCLHVRPALNLRDPDDEQLLRSISDEVVQLVKKYGGVLWGEHGKGFRGEYTPVFFGPELYEQLRRIKGAFDPFNQLNPGKLATPAGSSAELISIDTVKRGQFDRQIDASKRARFASVVHCNGNGACFDWDPDSVMCPSFNVTRDRIHSPKGRAGIMREWLRLMSLAGHDAGANAQPARGSWTSLWRSRQQSRDDFSHQVYDAMNGCLACKACATQCPIKVDVPAFRSQFFDQYHTRYRRPLLDYFVANLERVLTLLGRFPRLSNALLRQRWFSRLLERVVGVVDSPLLSENTLEAGLGARGAPRFDTAQLGRLSAAEKRRTVLIAQDAFTTFYEAPIALAAYDLLTHLGLRVVFLPYRENGKALHIKGFLRAFERVVRRNTHYYSAAAQLGIPLVGLEPAVTLSYRDEYPHALGTAQPELKVELLQEYLSARPELLSAIDGRKPRGTEAPIPYYFYSHCTEKTAAPGSIMQWQQVFRACNLTLQAVATGCCGMCGVYGHEAIHREDSRGVFALSWAKHLPPDAAARQRVLATGHSCRSQVKRFAGFVPKHPVQALLEELRAWPLPDSNRDTR